MASTLSLSTDRGSPPAGVVGRRVVDSSSHGSNFDPTRDGQGIAECVE
jgi:hypothetical protein